MSEAVRVLEKAAPFYEICNATFPDTPWASALTLYNVSDKISFEPSPILDMGPGLHYIHKCVFGIGDTGIFRTPCDTSSAVDSETFTIRLDLYTQNPSFRGLSAFKSVDVGVMRDVMHLSAEMKLGDQIISEATILGGCLSPEDLVVDINQEHLGAISSLCGVDPTPELAREFSHVIHCLLKNVVGKKWGDSAHVVLSKLMFLETLAEGLGSGLVQEPFPEKAKFVRAGSKLEFSDQDSVDSGDTETELDCCEARWYAVETTSLDAGIATIIFQYTLEPEEVWKAVRYHLTNSEIRELKKGVDMLKLAADFYELSHQDVKLSEVDWIDALSVTRVLQHVDTELKGSHDCSYQCDFVLGNERLFECALSIEGKFSKTFRGAAGTGIVSYRADGKHRNDRDGYTMRLHVDGFCVKPLHGQGKIDANSLGSLVRMNRAYIRAIWQDLNLPHIPMEKFESQISLVLWELLNGTCGRNSEFRQLVIEMPAGTSLHVRFSARDRKNFGVRTGRNMSPTGSYSTILR